MIRILVIGRHEEIMNTVLRLCNGEEGWHADGALTNEEALYKFSNGNYNAVLIGGGVTEAEEQELSADFKKQNPQIRIIRHYGGGSGLLFAEILEAIKQS